MRAIINISVPEKMKTEIEEAVKVGGYATKSEFLRDVLRFWKEHSAVASIRQSQKEFAQGKGKTLRSLKDLR